MGALLCISHRDSLAKCHLQGLNRRASIDLRYRQKVLLETITTEYQYRISLAGYYYVRDEALKTFGVLDFEGFPLILEYYYAF